MASMPIFPIKTNGIPSVAISLAGPIKQARCKYWVRGVSVHACGGWTTVCTFSCRRYSGLITLLHAYLCNASESDATVKCIGVEYFSQISSSSLIDLIVRFFCPQRSTPEIAGSSASGLQSEPRVCRCFSRGRLREMQNPVQRWPARIHCARRR